MYRDLMSGPWPCSPVLTRELLRYAAAGLEFQGGVHEWEPAVMRPLLAVDVEQSSRFAEAEITKKHKKKTVLANKHAVFVV